jgi:hypothetical protein
MRRIAQVGGPLTFGKNQAKIYDQSGLEKLPPLSGGIEPHANPAGRPMLGIGLLLVQAAGATDENTFC